MATPIIETEGATSGAATGDREDLVEGEEVTVRDTNPANVGKSGVWSFLDTPVDSDAELDDPTADETTFTADVTGSYWLQRKVAGKNGRAIVGVPLENSLVRMPTFQEQLQYGYSGNKKGWHTTMTKFMRWADANMGGPGGGGAGWVDRVKTMAQENTGIDTDQMGYIWTDFDYFEAAEWAAATGWSAATGNSSLSRGGVVNGSNASLRALSTIITNPDTDKFFVYCKMRCHDNSADAVNFNIAGFSNQTESALFGIGLAGSNNNGGVTNYGVHAYPSNGGVIDTGVPFSTDFHEFYMWADGTTLFAQVDDSDPVSTAQSDLSLGNDSWVKYMLINTGSFAGGEVDRLAYAFEGAA